MVFIMVRISFFQLDRKENVEVVQTAKDWKITSAVQRSQDFGSVGRDAENKLNRVSHLKHKKKNMVCKTILLYVFVVN